MNTGSWELHLGCESGSTGTYELSGTWQVSAEAEYVGDEGTGVFRHTGGTNTISTGLYLGHQSGSMGTYQLSGTSMVSAPYECIGYLGTGGFTQTDGTNTVSTKLYLGCKSGSVGTYTISGGVLGAATLHVGYDGAGTLAIMGTAAQVNVSSLLRFGTDSTFSAVLGSAIHMTGADFANVNTDPADLAGLGNLALIFEGGTGVTDDFEAAGQDKGADLAGWTDNFALSTLQLGGSAAGRIRLVDSFDNQPSWVGDEALYTGTLVMNAGATIDPGELNLYYLNGGGPKQFFRGDAKLDGNVDVLDLAALGNNFESTGATWAQADFNGDELVDVLDLAILANNFGSETGGLVGTPVPEPASAALLAMGFTVLLARRRQRRPAGRR